MVANGNRLDATALEPRPNLSHQLTRQLLKLIETRSLEPGDRLPSMKELAALFSVATPTIREALRRLQTTGVIDIRHGSGIFVRNVAQGVVIANPHHGELDADSVMQLLEARLAIEPFLAGRAAEYASAVDIAALGAILDEAEHLLSGQDARLGPTNMRLHRRIARISRNDILAEFLESLTDVYSREQLGILELFNARVRDHQDHIAIVEAIRNHDPVGATSQMAAHITGVLAVVARRLHDGVAASSSNRQR